MEYHLNSCFCESSNVFLFLWIMVFVIEYLFETINCYADSV